MASLFPQPVPTSLVGYAGGGGSPGLPADVAVVSSYGPYAVPGPYFGGLFPPVSASPIIQTTLPRSYMPPSPRLVTGSYDPNQFAAPGIIIQGTGRARYQLFPGSYPNSKINDSLFRVR